MNRIKYYINRLQLNSMRHSKLESAAKTNTILQIENSGHTKWKLEVINQSAIKKVQVSQI